MKPSNAICTLIYRFHRNLEMVAADHKLEL